MSCRRKSVTTEQAAAMLPPLTPAHMVAMREEGDGPDYFVGEDGEAAYWVDDLRAWATRVD